MPATRIGILAVGRLKETYWTDACKEYRNRIARYADIAIEEVSDRGNWDADDPAQALRREGEQIAQRLQGDELVVMLDRCGKAYTSEEIAALIQRQQDAGAPRLRFVIGGSHGIAPELLKQADIRLSFGPITLPHMLARVVLLEQLYRAFKIIADEPYHK